MDNSDTAMTKLFLMGRLHIKEGLIEKRAEVGSLVKSNNTVVRLDFFQSTEHLQLISR